jgi:hypothetical protein
VSLLIQRELFTQEEILSSHCGTKAQAESKEAHGVNPLGQKTHAAL